MRARRNWRCVRALARLRAVSRCSREKQLAERGRSFGFGEQRFVGAQNQLRAVADLDQVRAGANGRDGGFIDGKELEDAAHLEIVGKDDAL